LKDDTIRIEASGALKRGEVTPGAVRAPLLARLAATLLRAQLSRLKHGRLRLVDEARVDSFGEASPAAPFDVTIRVRDPQFYADAVFAGTTGAGEAYMNGHWECDDLTGLVRLMVFNRELMNSVDSGWSRLSEPLFRCAHWLNRNTHAGSRRNIAAHYDLGNDFFKLFLDESMAYSCGIFEQPQSTLHEASVAKFDAVCSKLGLKPGQHLLEIGTGWGGLAVHAAKHYGCRVTTTTISKEQYEYSKALVAREGLADRITLLLDDYRDLKGEYDALASVEMIEAVGYQYLDTYIEHCSRRLKPDGVMLLQAITVRDQFFEQARRSVDFIKRYIFPGSFIPSVQAIGAALSRKSDMKIVHLEDIGPHYARTLNAWRQRLFNHLEDVRALGYPDRFIRMWEYYLCYCEGGFEERQLGTVQMLLAKPRSRRAAISTVHAARS
jgi:cyclopropane-fatty-acyl-phospholipid synthase